MAIALACAAPSAGASISTPLVIGGGRAEGGSYPWVASVTVELEGEYVQCGGSLIAPRFVLTAAHCVIIDDALVDPQQVTVSVASVDREAGEVRRAVRVTAHPGYLFPDQAAVETGGGRFDLPDIAVIELARGVDVSPIRLATEADAALEQPGGDVRVLGWGTTARDERPSPRYLREAALKIFDASVCGRTTFIDPAIDICAGTEDGTRDACSGDSGGPLMALDTELRPVLLGVVSHSGGVCATAGEGTVYTKVSAFSRFIDMASAASPRVRRVKMVRTGRRWIARVTVAPSRYRVVLKVFIDGVRSGRRVLPDLPAEATLDVALRQLPRGVHRVRVVVENAAGVRAVSAPREFGR